MSNDNPESFFEPPQGEIEEKLTKIWEEVFGFEKIGRHDNFFALGGHSLLAAQIADKINEKLHLDLNILDIFNQTIADIAKIAPKKAHKGLEIPQIEADLQNRYEPFPLSPIQQAYWVGRRSEFIWGGTSCHIYVEIDSKDLDLERFEKAWNLLIQRHDMLRAIIEEDGQQRILREVKYYRIECHDLRELPENERKLSLAKTRAELSHEVLSTNRWPLFTLQASHLPGNLTRIHFNYDLLIGDAWSYVLLMDELFRLYNNPKELPKHLNISFREYVLAEATLKNTDAYQNDLNYWQSRVQSLPGPPELPILTKSLKEKSHFSRREGKLTKTQWQKLQLLAQEANITPAALLITVFCEVLGHWSKTPHFTLNLTQFRRFPMHPEVNQLVGDFTTLILLEVQNAITRSFFDRTQITQKQLLEDLSHSVIHGIEVLRMLGKAQHNPFPLMPVVFTSWLGIGSLYKERFGKIKYAITETPQVYLDHQVAEENGELHYSWDAIEALFPQHLLDDMFEAYQRLLLQLLDQKAWEATTHNLTSQVMQSLCDQINSTSADIPSQLMITPFSIQAKKNPDEIAIITSNKQITYRELDVLSNNFALQIQNLKIKSGELIAIVCDKGWEQIVSVLAIQKAGGAYLPVNPAIPPQRLKDLLAQAEVKIVLTQKHFQDTLLWPQNINLISVDTYLETKDTQALKVIQKSDDLAYVIYTSGSTGNPKGVMIQHRSAMNTIIDINRRFHISKKDKILAFSSLSFDLSVYDIFGMLSEGASIVIPDADKIKNPDHWLALIEQHEVTIWNSVPMAMQMLVEYLQGQKQKIPHSLRLILLSGDWIPLELVPKIHELSSSPIEIISLGGATEASIWSVYYPIKRIEDSWKSIPYGKPLSNQQIWVFDDNLEVRPSWVIGKLYIGGSGLAKGYWKDEKMTRDSFIFHPLTQERLYNTGDLGRYLPSGNIEFLGRDDFQVKISGHRVELGEVEYQLSRNPSVEQAIVDAVGEGAYRQLVAYILPKGIKEEDEMLGQAVIRDFQKKNAFRLKQIGIRQFPSNTKMYPIGSLDNILNFEEKYFYQKRYRKFAEGTLKHRQLVRLLELIPIKEIDIEDDTEVVGCNLVTEEGLDQLLSVFAAYAKDLALPNYRYFSGGRLYPVNVYVWLTAQNPCKLAEGVYYYNPILHGLFLVTPTQVDEIRIEFVANLNAISPLYGPLAMRLCELEAGSMQHLLKSACEEKKYSCIEGENDLEETLSLDLLKLDKNHHLLSVFYINSLKTFPTSQNIKPPKVFVYVKPDRFYDLIQGLYIWKDNKLEIIDPSYVLDSYAYGFNADLLNEAAFSIFFIGESNPLVLREVGEQIQKIMENRLEGDIGFYSPLAAISSKAMHSIPLIAPNETFLCGILGGYIDNELKQAPSIPEQILFQK